ncbi:MAG: hypothetical protein OXC14_04520 [Rhodospirillaceae bacterium]|nr:hypothetical protein [Rhodospirillaceae bacterium]
MDNRAFGVGLRLAKLKGSYPPADQVFAAAGVGNRERAVLARLWISEGIPFAFRKCPGLYEEVRNWLAAELELDAKEISVAGSGRLGYSLAPKRWGQRYRPESSDLDFFAVSASLFERLRGDFDRWRADFTQGILRPKQGEQRNWEANRMETPRSIGRGFIDSWRVPNRLAYGEFLRMNRRLEELSVRLRRTEPAPKPPKAPSLRCYRDWGSYERR